MTKSKSERAFAIVADCRKQYPEILNNAHYLRHKIEQDITEALQQVENETIERCAKVAYDNDDCYCHKEHIWDCCGSDCSGHISEAILALRIGEK